MEPDVRYPGRNAVRGGGGGKSSQEDRQNRRSPGNHRSPDPGHKPGIHHLVPGSNQHQIRQRSSIRAPPKGGTDGTENREAAGNGCRVSRAAPGGCLLSGHGEQGRDHGPCGPSPDLPGDSYRSPRTPQGVPGQREAAYLRRDRPQSCVH